MRLLHETYLAFSKSSRHQRDREQFPENANNCNYMIVTYDLAIAKIVT